MAKTSSEFEQAHLLVVEGHAVERRAQPVEEDRLEDGAILPSGEQSDVIVVLDDGFEGEPTIHPNSTGQDRLVVKLVHHLSPLRINRASSRFLSTSKDETPLVDYQRDVPLFHQDGVSNRLSGHRDRAPYKGGPVLSGMPELQDAERPGVLHTQATPASLERWRAEERVSWGQIGSVAELSNSLVISWA